MESLSMRINNTILKFIPLRYHLPVRYLGRKVSGTLEVEISFLKDLVRPGQTSIDIGANYGIYSYALSKLSAAVEAFEPNPQCAAELCAFGAHNIHVHSVGLSSESGDRNLHIPVTNGIQRTESACFSRYEGNQEIIPVRVSTLDQYNFVNVSFIKIDVEGHELEVLRGAYKTIMREKPVLLVEIEQRHLDCPMQNIFNQILDLGYHGFFYDDFSLRSLSEFAYEKNQKPFEHDVMNGQYIHNFIFKPV